MSSSFLRPWKAFHVYDGIDAFLVCTELGIIRNKRTWSAFSRTSIEAENNRQDLLKPPPELRQIIYTSVFDNQILEVTRVNRQMRLVGATNAHLFGLPSTCRLLYRETKDLPRAKTAPIFANVNRFYALLNSVPAPHNNRFEVVGVTYGYDVVEYMWPDKILGYISSSVDSNKARLKDAIHEIYPNAEVNFRTARNTKEY
ncbi:hypothetical protein B5807_05846 [Epicoccum nigrum]|uniref:Uncharacterized protein n=1 Tax=Epicoccum nigrum TaxID=105696 RepID=A0A1Y2M0A0_EPING|nr:hypothetical protein B5807_05846 [Epicoccum nigrum]